MSKIKDYVMEMEEKGELIYSDYRNEYLTPPKMALSDQIEYLEWQIMALKRDLQTKVREYNNAK